MNVRAAALFLGLVFVSLPAQAQQGPPAGAGGVAGQVADLEARVAKLEGNIVAADLAGTYSVTGVDTPLSALVAGNPPRNATIQSIVFTGTLTVNANGTGVLSPTTCSGSMLTQGPWTLVPVNCNGDSPQNFTWTYANGNVTATFSGELGAMKFSVGLGGRLLTTVFAPFHTDDKSSDSVLLILMRLQ